MFRFWFLLGVLFLQVYTAFSQQAIQQYVRQNISEIKTVSFDSTDQYTDLHPLGAAIGSARIVMLGEQDHGDAPSFLAKTRIIRYLHEQLGFDVLAFESDFWGLESLSRLPGDSFSIEQVRTNTYAVWNKCVQAQPVYEYVAAKAHTTHPLTVTGVDCRHSLMYSQKHYLQYMADSVLPVVTLPEAEKEFFLQTVADILSKEFTKTSSTNNADHFYRLCATIQKELPVNSFAAIDIQSLSAAAHHAWHFDYRNAARDIQMAANLRWLAEYGYPGKKIIVWAHSMHIAKNLQLIPDKGTAPYITTLGNETYKYFGRQLYILGFDSYVGTAGSIGGEHYKVKPAKKHSFEQYALETNYSYAFINLQSPLFTETFYMKGLSHLQSFKVNWSQIFDGVFYIRDMYPCDERQ